MRMISLLAPILLGLLAACSQPPAEPPNQFAPIAFKSAPPFQLKVDSVEVVREYTPPLQLPNVDHRFPIPPMAMAERWQADRLVALGGPNHARFVIKQASVVEVPLAMKSGVTAAFTTQQAYRYDAVIEVELQIINDRGFRDGVVTSRVEQHQTVAEDVSPAGRERIWYGMTQTMARDLDAELDRNIKTILPRFLGF